MKEHKFVGTIIDESYFKPYRGMFYDIHEGKIRARGALLKICECCGAPRPLTIEDKMTRGQYHDCEKMFVFGSLRWEWGQFVFIPAEGR